MIATRQSGARARNERFRAVDHPGSNRDWLAAAGNEVVRAGAVILLGGTNVIDFRVRVSQGHLRHDLLPSFWSLAGILCSGDTFLSVPLDDHLSLARVPAANAIFDCALADYDDPVRYPNIAVVNFADHGETVVSYARELHKQRSAVDLPQLVVAWLAFAWGTANGGNPLLQHLGLPSAAFVETAFGIGGIEMTPGSGSAGSCPEALWQSAIWWHRYYENTAGAFPAAASRADLDETDLPTPIVPNGAYLVRQPAAAAREE